MMRRFTEDLTLLDGAFVYAGDFVQHCQCFLLASGEQELWCLDQVGEETVDGHYR